VIARSSRLILLTSSSSMSHWTESECSEEALYGNDPSSTAMAAQGQCRWPRLGVARVDETFGVLGLLIGFESVQKATQNEVMKITNLGIDFYEAMRRFHGEGSESSAPLFSDLITKTRMCSTRPRVHNEKSYGCCPDEDPHSVSGNTLIQSSVSEGRLFARDCGFVISSRYTPFPTKGHDG